MAENLSVAFVWHMHQPIYKDYATGQYMMPWVRLHAIKDYLNMLLLLEEFPDINQTFNLVPSLLEQIIDYGEGRATEEYLRLSQLDAKDLNDSEKNFILDHFFDANFVNMIYPHEHYKKLHDKRFQQENIGINSFSDQEYSDIIAWFNLSWFHSYWFEKNTDLKNFYEKGCDFTLEDRKKIISIQNEIIRQIIPKYKELYKKGRIEISTSPYYHPILPLLINSDSAKRASIDVELPKTRIDFIEDAIEQTLNGIEKFKKIFGKAPDGMWPSEQAISPESLKIMADLGIKWTITDEGILAKTLGKEFIRDFQGEVVDPLDLSKIYQVETGENNIFILFRNSVFADLISFEYGNAEPEIAANDLYERIKNIQEKLLYSPEKHHVVTIAMDGENCWESYEDNGRKFLSTLYQLLSEDETLDITTVSDVIKKIQAPSILKNIHSGSWINRDFKLWIGEPTKNQAWEYLHKTRSDLIDFQKSDNYSVDKIKTAWEEIYISEGSDWFWWYGEPNDSGQDEVWDSLFRSHLKNVYKILDKPHPQYLDTFMDISKQSENPKGIISPSINSKVILETEWANAGCIEISQSPTYQTDKVLRRICFGCNENNLFFKLDINPYILEKSLNDIYTHEIYFYFLTANHFNKTSPVRLRSKSSNLYSNQKYYYSHEIEISINQGHILSPVLSEALDGNLWKIKMSNNLIYNYNSALVISVPFVDINASQGQDVHFTIALSRANILQEIIPSIRMISVKRPD